MTQVPAATRALAVLKLLAAQPGPLPATAIARDLGLPRSTTYHLLNAMRDSGFVVHLPEEERWALGVAAFEIGAAYSRHDPLARLARPAITKLVRELSAVPVVGQLAVLHGTETLYILKVESSRKLPLITEVGVRLPAALTASGRAILAAESPSQVRAAFSVPTAFVNRTGRGPVNWPQLRELLDADRAAGFSSEEEFVTEGLASVAVPVRDHLHQPIAAIGLTFNAVDLTALRRKQAVSAARQAASGLSRRLGER